MKNHQKAIYRTAPMYANLTAIEIPRQTLVAEAKDYNVFFNRWLYGKDLTFSWRANIRLAIKVVNGCSVQP